MKIALSPILVEYKNFERNKKTILSRIDKALEEGVDIICLPEYCITGYDYSKDKESANLAEVILNPFIEKLLSITQESSLNIIIGVLEKEADKTYNSALFISKGKIKLKHRKIQEGGIITRGNEVDVINTEFGRIAIIICGDIFNKFVISELQKKKPDFVFMPMDRNLGEGDFCGNYKEECDRKSCKKEMRLHGCYDKIYNTHEQAWNEKSKLEYCEQAEKISATTVIVNFLANNHKDACGGALYINFDGKLRAEIPYGKDDFLVVSAPKITA
ncbi:MAG: carbon-nitrogen hydrolase family protein [Elusimicrobiales bacterium]|nr:carbon-nitrogen hydrolase family protein [Elusimicrobiales bacterium]